MNDAGTAKELFLVGTSSRTAPVEVREKARLTWPVLRDCEAAIGSLGESTELVLLETCNRSELYLAGSSPGAVNAWLDELRRRFPDNPLGTPGSPHIYRLKGGEAAEHLVRVACGLESTVLGDGQILGQVRRALGASAEWGALGPHLQKTFALALGAGARARRETDIGRGAASIGSALAGMLAARFRSEAGETKPAILVLGAGEIASDAASRIVKRDVGTVTIANRTERRAVELAGKLRVETTAWPRLPHALACADVVVAATSSPTTVVSRRLLEKARELRDGRPLLVVDLGVPRNVEEGSGCEVIDVDAIRESCQSMLSRRRRAVPEVERIVEKTLVAWRRFSASQTVESRIKRLYRAAGDASKRAGSELAALERFDSREAERIVLRSIKQLLHEHVRDLRAIASSLERERAG